MDRTVGQGNPESAGMQRYRESQKKFQNNDQFKNEIKSIPRGAEKKGSPGSGRRGGSKEEKARKDSLGQKND